MIDKTIDGKKYTFTMFGSEQSVKVMVRLFKLGGPSIAKLVSGGKDLKTILDQNTDDFDLGLALMEFCDRISEDIVVDTIKEFMTQVTYNSEDNGGLVSKMFDAHFSGNILHMFKVLGAALEVQYKDFFGAIGDVQGLLKKATAPKPT